MISASDIRAVIDDAQPLAFKWGQMRARLDAYEEADLLPHVRTLLIDGRHLIDAAYHTGYGDV